MRLILLAFIAGATVGAIFALLLRYFDAIL